MPQSTQEKVTLFCALFRGREDIHAVTEQSGFTGLGRAEILAEAEEEARRNGDL
jgi:hypothetical protein